MQRKGTCEIGIGIGAGNVIVPEIVFAQNLTYNANNYLIDDGNINRITAQSFPSGQTGNITSASLRMHRGSALLTGDWQLSIQADASGSPSNVDIAVVTLDATALGTSTPASFANFVFDVPVAVTSSTYYWLHFRSLLDGATSSGLYINYNSTDVYAGVYKYSTSGIPTWLTAAVDLEFTVYGTI